MATRYLIGKGELLTYPIDTPKKEPGEKVHPYTLSAAQKALIPQIQTAAANFKALPAGACPDDLAVATVTLHPAYLAKSYFPRNLLQATGLQTLGSRTKRISPRRVTRKDAPAESDTTQIFVAGRRSALSVLAGYASQLVEGTAEAMQFAQLEAFEAMSPDDRIRPAANVGAGVFEVGLHVPDGAAPMRLRSQFAAYAKQCGFEVNATYDFQAGRMLFVPVEGHSARLEQLALFTLMRVVRDMPMLRAARPALRSKPLSVGFQMPRGAPLSSEPRVAILDGGLPDSSALHPYVRRYEEVDPSAADVPDYVDHGLSVTSAVLFGPIEPSGMAERPYSMVDHHRVLDGDSDHEDPYELYRTLANIETVLLSRSYDFVNLSLGPDLCVEDGDVHAWTSVIDELLSDGQTLLSVAAGNNGKADAAAALNRIQVPADSVNALAVGATNHTNNGWARADYSAVGPGRSPGRRKPDVVAFGGSPREYFHVVAPGARNALSATLGTSFAAPLALRSAIGIRAILGADITPLAIKALLIHGCHQHASEQPDEIGWGRVPTDLSELITCDEGVARIIYQGELRPGKFLRAPVPLPSGTLAGKVRLTATFCYTTRVDPQDAGSYTKAGLNITFRPHASKRDADAQNAKSKTFFPASTWRTEEEQRADLHKWETVLHGTNSYFGTSLEDSVFDIHYNARDSGGPASGPQPIRYALVITVSAPRHPQLYDDILAEHTLLKALEPVVSLPVRLNRT